MKGLPERGHSAALLSWGGAKEVVAMLGAGLTNAEIARRIGVETGTVKV
ncbi:hypothetical protein [Streptomyces sp. CB02959]|nr:hypothetical protein [Streptomyces sp. CB02959]